MRKFLLIFLVGIMACSCGNDSDGEPETSGSLSDTTWEVTDDSSGDINAGLTVTFKANGDVKFRPSIWSYARWQQTDTKLKIVIGEEYPDDYLEGNYMIDGNKATYMYSWYDIDGAFQSGPYTMHLLVK